MDNEFFQVLAGNPLLAIQVGIFTQSYSAGQVSVAVAKERADLAHIFEQLATEHAAMDNEQQNVITALVYRDVAEKMRNRG